MAAAVRRNAKEEAMSDLFDFLKNILPPENIFEIKIDNMESRFEDMTKEELIQRLDLALKENRGLSDMINEQWVDEKKKREFERRLAEATDFLKANGYDCFPKPLENESSLALAIRTVEMCRYKIIAPGVELKWTDEDMIAFAYHFYLTPSILAPMVALKNFEQRHKP